MVVLVFRARAKLEVEAEPEEGGVVWFQFRSSACARSRCYYKREVRDQRVQRPESDVTRIEMNLLMNETLDAREHSTWVELLVEKDFGSASPPTDSYTFEYA